MPDLICSKETERESDWQDVALLEEIQDSRLFARSTTAAGAADALVSVRSQRGYARVRETGLLQDAAVVSAAWARAIHPVSRAFLAPGQPRSEVETRLPQPFAVPLRESTPGAARHLALVEAVRRWHKQNRLLADRADKQREMPG